MNTPRIEEMVEEFENLFGEEDFGINKLRRLHDQKYLKEVTDWLRKALTEAHQAGIDEERERICKVYEDYCNHDIDLPEWHKALQDK
jgi:hypothetical protein